MSDLSEYSAELFGIGGKPTKKEKKEILKKLKEAKIKTLNREKEYPYFHKVIDDITKKEPKKMKKK